jgi:predicted permease
MIMGLLDQSLLHLLDEHRGFTTGHVFSVEVVVSGQGYAEDASRAAFDEEILRRLRSLPGVQSAGLVSAMPLSGENWVDGVNRRDRANSDAQQANYRWISPDYLSTLHIPLLRGRQLIDSDRNLKSALISERTAKTCWPGEDPIGRQFSRGGANTTYTVVGVVADTLSNSLKEQPGLIVYLPYWDYPPYSTFFMVRTAQDSAAIEETMRRQIWSHDPEANISRVRSLDEQVNESLAPERSQAFVLSSFGFAALLLAVLGIYGVLSYSIARRVRELGIRIALGASRGSLYVLTMMEAAWPVLAGLAGGMTVSFITGYLIRSLGVTPVNIPVTALTAVVFILATVMATYLPARRAASIDPIESLRME